MQVQGSLTIGPFLNSLGLGKYAILFQAEEVSNLHLVHNKLEKTRQNMPFIFAGSLAVQIFPCFMCKL